MEYNAYVHSYDNVTDVACTDNLVPAANDNGSFMQEVLDLAAPVPGSRVVRGMSQGKVVHTGLMKGGSCFSVFLHQSEGKSKFHLNIPGKYSEVSRRHLNSELMLRNREEYEEEGGVGMLDFTVGDDVKALFMNRLAVEENCVSYDLWATAANFDAAAEFILGLIRSVVQAVA